MGNQGTTNWKFSAFFVIALMLVAGLFSTTAMAASGDGRMAFTTPTDPAATRLVADSVQSSMVLEYTLDLTEVTLGRPLEERDKMNGGLLQIDIPDGWKFVDPDDNLAEGVTVGTGGTLISGITADPIVIQLAADFGEDATSHTLEITLTNIQVPIPPRLTDGTEADPYEQYQFTASSRSRVGRLDTLNPTTLFPQPQPFVRVGNIASGTGTFTVSPDEIYETYANEKPRKITMIYTAKGPMWNSSMVVTLPTALAAVVPGAKSGESGYLRVTNRGGSDIDFDINTNVATNVVTIPIDVMNTNQGVEIIYYSAYVPPIANTADATAFTVTTDATDDDTDNGAAVTVETGKLRRKDGSGTMMVSDMYVEIADDNEEAELKNFTLTYTAKTNLENATLTIVIPEELTGLEDDGNTADVDESTDLIDIARNVVGTDSDTRNRNDAGYVYSPDRHSAPADLEVTGGNTITWHDLTISMGQKFRTIIRVDISQTVDDNGDIMDDTNDTFDTVDDGVYPFNTSVDDLGYTGETDISEATAATNDAMLYAVKGDNETVTFALLQADGTPYAADADIQYNAASLQTLTFRFTADTTTIKGGSLSIRIPQGWSPTPELPNDKDNNAGRVKATLDNDADRASGDPAAIDGKKKIGAGRTTTVTVDALREDGAIDVTFHDITVQRNADTVDFIGEFKTRSGAPSRRAGRIEIEVLNVEDGSGSATITTGRTPRYSVKAGSVDNKITVVFTADGTMDGGQVTLERPADWGDMQDSDAAELNYVKVAASSGASITSNVGRDLAVANISSLGHNGKITFTINDAEASSELGISEYVIKSKGSAASGATLMPLAGEQQGDDDGPEDLLTGKIYWIDEDNNDKFTRGTDTANGILRINVSGAADGTGEAMVEIRGSDHEGKYGINADGEADKDAVTRQVHAGSTGTYLLFTYSPSQTIEDGELRFTVDPDWSPPQDEEQGEAGYTFLDEVGQANIGTPVFSDDSITVEIIEITKQDAILIHYGWHGTAEGNAVAPTSVETSGFGIQIKGSETGSLKSIRTPPTVQVREQASGEGTAEIDPTTATAGGTATIMIEYEAEGEIEDGSLKLTVPDKWSGAARESFEISGGGGSARYDLDYDTDNPKPAAADVDYDIPGAREVIYSGISLSAGGTVTFTYTTDVIGALGGQTFNLAFKGGDGPDDDFKAVSDLTVTVNEAAPGDGNVAVRGADGITAGSTDNEISFVYVATGAIDYEGTFAVRVPETWDEDGPAASDYTVTYEDADGNLLRGTQESVEEVAPKDQDMLAQIKGANSPLITAGHQVVFNYTSDAPATPGSYDFIVFYDEEQVGDPIEVLILSADEAEMVSVSVTDKLMDTKEAIPVTVNLLAADGITDATRNTALTVTLSSDAAAGMFSTGMDSTAIFTSTLPLTFNPGDNEMMAYYKDDNSHVATITATPDAASAIPAATADVDTEVLVVSSVSFTVNDDATETFAKADDKVAITVEATPKRTAPPVVAIGSVASLSTAEKADMLGTYTAEWTVVADVHDGTHAVTATLGDLDPVAASAQLTVDTVSPIVTITEPAADMIAVNGATVTITATAPDGDKSSGISAVTAAVSAVDNTRTEMVALTDDDGDGTYTGSFTISTSNTAADGSPAIVVTAMDNAGNSGSATVMVILDNTDPMVTNPSIDMKEVMVGGEATISVTLSEEATVTADVSMLNAAAPTLSLMDADGEGEGMVYSGSVMVTEEGDAEDIAIAITATDAAGNIGTASVDMVTLDNTAPMITDESIDMSNVKMGDTVTISATLSEAATVSADVSGLNADDTPLPLMDVDGEGEGMVYGGTVTVTADGDAEDIAIAITATDAAGNAGTASVMVSLDNTDPMITDESIDMSNVKMGDTVTISAMVSEAADVSADVSGLNADESPLSLMDADGSGMYSASVMVTADGDAEVTITITASDAAGNEAEAATVMATLDNTAPEVTGESIDMSNVMAGDTVTISAMVSEAADVSADVSGLNADESPLSLMDADDSGMYSGSVMVTADSDEEVTIAITATDAAGNMGTASVMVSLDNTAPTVEASADKMYAKNGDTVMLTAMVSEAANVSATVSQLDDTQLVVELMDEDSDLTYTGSVMISMSNGAADGSKEVTVTATDAAGNSGTASVSVMLDNTVPEVTDVSVSPSPARNGHPVSISATVSEASTVSVDVSDLDTMQTEMVALTDDDGDGTYTGSFTISDDNEAENGTRQVTVTATDAAGNSGSDTGTVDLINTLDYTSVLPAGISLFHVPLDVTAIDGSEASLSMVSDLYKALGDEVNYLITYDGTSWNSYLGGDSGDAAITADLGIVAVMKAEKTITFTGNAWGEDDGPGAGEGASMINLRVGLTLIGLPVNDASISTVGSLLNLPEFAGKVSSIIVSTDDGKFAVISAAGGPDDVAVRGDAAYLVSSSDAAMQSVTGEGWSNGETVGAAPIALFGHKVDNQTAALFVEGSIVDELTGVAKEGFRIKVKNLSTKAALSSVSQSDVAQGGYNMTFVDTKVGNAARIGDVLEISADSPNPLIGVKPVRHVVTVDDVKNSRIQLEDLVAYEIPAETALLNNYPNPFNPETWIPYHLSEDADVKLTIYNVNGEVVRDIDVGHQTAAKYDTRSKAIYWDGRNRFGEQVASGIYFYHLQAGDFSGTRKMVILK